MEYIPQDPILQFRPDTLVAVRKIYNLDGPGRMEESVKILEEWCKKQAHFVKKDFGISYYEKTLIASKGSIEKAKKQIDRICTMRTLLPRFFVDCDIKKDLKSITEKAWLLPLPKMTKDYCRAMIIKINAKDFSSDHFMDYYRLNIIMCEYIKRHDYVNGFVIIDDYRNLNLVDVMRKINVIELQQFMTILIEGFGARMVGLHILTESKTVDLFLNFMKQFLSAKIVNRLHVHSNINSLYSIVDKEILPIDYGGLECSVDQLNQDWIEVLSSNDHTKYVRMMNKACTNEAYRQTDTFNDQYMGTPGSFRTLNVD